MRAEAYRINKYNTHIGSIRFLQEYRAETIIFTGNTVEGTLGQSSESKSYSSELWPALSYHRGIYIGSLDTFACFFISFLDVSLLGKYKK